MRTETFSNSPDDPATSQRISSYFTSQVSAIETLLAEGTASSAQVKERYATSTSFDVFKKLLTNKYDPGSPAILKSNLLGVKIGMAINERIDSLGAIENWDLSLAVQALRTQRRWEKDLSPDTASMFDTSAALVKPYRSIHEKIIPYLPFDMPSTEGLRYVEDGMRWTMYASHQLLMARHVVAERPVQQFREEIDKWDGGIPPAQ